MASKALGYYLARFIQYIYFLHVLAVSEVLFYCLHSRLRVSTTEQLQRLQLPLGIIVVLMVGAR